MIALVGLVACRGEAPPADDPAAERRAVLAALTDRVIVGGYTAFRDRSAELHAATEALCASPTEATLQAARDAWWAAHEPWKRAEIVQFGPVVEYPWRVGPTVDLWPANLGAIQEVLDGDGPLDADVVAGMGGATRGLPVLEVLLYGADASPGAFAEPRRCTYTALLAGDLVAQADLLLAVWQDEWAARLADPAARGDDAYDVPQDVIDEWVNRMLFTVEDVKAEKLGKPLGDATGGEVLLDALESPFAERSLQDARDALVGVGDVFGDADRLGLRALLPADRAGVADDFDQTYAGAADRLARVPEPLQDTIAVQPEVVVAAQDALRELQVAIQVDVAQALSVTVVFNDNDGD